MARESYFYWLDWGRYLGVPTRWGSRSTSTPAASSSRTTATGTWSTSWPRSTSCMSRTRPHAEGSARLPWMDTRTYGHRSPPTTALRRATGRAHPRRGLHPGVRLHRRSHPRVPQPPAGLRGAWRRVSFQRRSCRVLKSDGRVSGIRLADGSRIHAPVVVNVGGPHSAIINGMAGVLDGMNITTRALKQEVCYVPAPAGMDYHQLAPSSRTATSAATRDRPPATTS